MSIESTAEKALHNVVTGQFPVNSIIIDLFILLIIDSFFYYLIIYFAFPASKLQDNVNFAGFVELAKRVEQPITQSESIREFLPLVGTYEEVINDTLINNPILFIDAVHNHYGVFYLLTNYFKPKIVEGWARSAVPKSSGLIKNINNGMIDY